MSKKEEMAFIVEAIIKALAQHADSGQTIILHFGDAKITIEAEADQ
jgi:hypothetical protein